MDLPSNNTDNLFSIPVALFLRNGTGLDESGPFGYYSSPGGNVSNSSHAWNKMDDFAGPHNPRSAAGPERLSETIRRELKWAFTLHTYGFGCLFFILASYTFFSVLNLRSFISSRPFMSTINGFLCMLGTSRAGSLLIDPYNLREMMPKIIGQVLWDLGFPSIISAFCLVQLAFLQLTQLQIGPEGLRRKSCLSLVVTAHFILTIGIDIVVASHENLMIVRHVIQYIFLTWGVFLCCNFLYSGYKVMSMIRSIPGGLKHRDLPDPSYKGIMQLAILAPHNNLAGSVAAALIPTLCAPKIHQQDNTSLSTVGFRNDGNSRILESESIPILEEIAGSSGDEKNTKLLTRGSSFQNQTRNTQKFNLKPKLSLRSVSDEDVRDGESNSRREPKSPRSVSPKSGSPKHTTSSSSKSTEFDFSVAKPTGGILKHTTENFVTTKSIYEFKSKMQQQRTSFENENFHFSGQKRKSKSDCGDVKPGENSSSDMLIPNILISCPDGGDEESAEAAVRRDSTDRVKFTGRNQTNLTKVMTEITNDLKEMEIVREKKNSVTEETVEVHVENLGKGKKIHLTSDPRRKCKDDHDKGLYGIRRESQSSCGESRRNSYKRDGVSFTPGDSSGSNSSTLMEITKYEETSGTGRVRGRRKTKSLSWKKKNREDDEEDEDEEDEEDDEEEVATQECLLPQENATDVSLRSVLNHIAYMNRGQQSNGNAEDDLEKVRKSKVEWVLNITYITAMWGLMLCLSNMGRIYSPFGVPESRKSSLPSHVSSPTSTPSVSSPSSSPPPSSLSPSSGYPSAASSPSPLSVASNSTFWTDHGPTESTGTEFLFSPWPWLWFQTFCRALELAMGCAMANITRQPTANYRYPRTLSIRHRDTFYSI